MMGVKPNIVLDTMLRHNISPENVSLCSDNDTAGNEFAQRLQEQYPDMKRVITPDTYKDWNDMLRGIPKAVEHKKDYLTLDEAIKAGREYLADEYLGFSVFNTETKEIEHTEGSFPMDQAFSPDILRRNGFDILADQVQARMDGRKRERLESPEFLGDLIGNFYGAGIKSSETVDGKWKIAVGDKAGEATVYEFGRPFCTIHETADKFVIDTFFARDKENAQLVYEAMMAHHTGMAHKPVEVNVPEPKVAVCMSISAGLNLKRSSLHP